MKHARSTGGVDEGDEVKIPKGWTAEKRAGE
jgi:hypothetical protein